MNRNRPAGPGEPTPPSWGRRLVAVLAVFLLVWLASTAYVIFFTDPDDQSYLDDLPAPAVAAPPGSPVELRAGTPEDLDGGGTPDVTLVVDGELITLVAPGGIRVIQHPPDAARCPGPEGRDLGDRVPPDLMSVGLNWCVATAEGGWALLSDGTLHPDTGTYTARLSLPPPTRRSG